MIGLFKQAILKTLHPVKVPEFDILIRRPFDILVEVYYDRPPSHMAKDDISEARKVSKLLPEAEYLAYLTNRDYLFSVWTAASGKTDVLFDQLTSDQLEYYRQHPELYRHAKELLMGLAKVSEGPLADMVHRENETAEKTRTKDNARPKIKDSKTAIVKNNVASKKRAKGKARGKTKKKAREKIIRTLKRETTKVSIVRPIRELED